MKINVTENKVSIKEEQILNENEYNIHKIQFDFSSEYTDDLVKVALFSIDNHTYKKIISNNECDIPPEVLTQRGYSILGVYAYKTEQDTLVLRYSPSPTRISVYDGSYKAETENSEPITPSEIEQYQQILQNSLQQFQNQYNALVEETEGDIQAIEDELQRKVDEGYFDGEDGFSPIANVIQLSNGAKIEIEDKTGRTSASVFNGYSPQRGVDYWTQEDKEEVIEEATQQIEGKIEEYNENAAEKLNQYNQNSVQKTNDYNTNAEQKMSAYNTNATEKLSTYNLNATEKFNDYNSNAEQKETNYNTNASQKVESFNTNANNKLSEYNSNAETKKNAYDENATQKTNSFNTNATNKLTEYNTNHTEKMSAYNSNSIQKLNAFNENAIQKTEDFDEHTEEIQESIENLQTENARLKATLPTTTGEGQAITLNKTAELEFVKPPLPMGNSEQDGEPSLDNEAPITNVTGDVEVKVQNKNIFDIGTFNEDTSKPFRIRQNNKSSIILNGTTSSVTNFWFNNLNMKLKRGTYNLSFSYTNNNVTYFLRRNGTNIFATKKNQQQTINEDIVIDQILIQVSDGFTLNNQLVNIQLEQSSSPTEYTPHQEQTFPLTLGNIELCKIGDYQDYFYKESNKWYLHKEIGKVVLDGSENWIENSAYAGIFMINKQDIIQKYDDVYVISNYLLGKSNDVFYANISTIDNSTTNFGNSRLFIALRNYKNNLSGFKTWLSTHNTEVYYVLQASTDTEITDTTLISQLEAINDALSDEEQTNISGTSDGSNPIFNVEAYQSTKLVLEERDAKYESLEARVALLE